MQTIKAEKLSNKTKLSYALGAIPNGLLVYIFDLKYIEFFFNDLKLLPLYFIVGQIIYLIINAINDPLLGHLSDRTNREKWGSRRIIYIKYFGPIWALAFLFVWVPWSLDNQIIIFIHYIIAICLFDTLFTLVVTVWLALLPEMTADTGERSKTQFFVLIIGASVVLPMFLIVGAMKPTSLTFKIIAIIIAIVSTIMQLIVAKVCKERPEFQKDEVFPLWKSFKECFKLKSFRFYLGWIFFHTLYSSVSLSYLFAYLLILGSNGLLIFFLIYVFGFYSSYAICLKLRPKIGIRGIILRFGILRIIGTFICFVLWILTASTLFIILGYVMLAIFGGYSIFTFPMLYLSIDEDEVVHGTRRDGMFQGLQALFNKPAVSIGPIIATILLVSFGFVQGSQTQPESALFGITLLFLIYPVIIIGISLIFIYFYPLHGEILNNMEQKLNDIHRIKREKLVIKPDKS
jgi:GPH family glycoside/pentoside/hexuronide:cation symporter